MGSSILSRLEEGQLELLKLFKNLSKRGNVFPSTLVKLESKWATPVGSSIALNMVFNPMAPCPRKRSPIPEAMTLSQHFSQKLELANTSPGPFSWIWNLP